jgi:cytochrome c556
MDLTLAARFCRTIILVTSFASVSPTTSAEHAVWQGQQAPTTSAMPGMSAGGTQHECDDLHDMGGMSVMGESMGAMTNHMCITPVRPRQPGDEEKVKAMVAQVRAAIEKYKDYKKALADGYVIANPKVVQPQYHFTNDANVRLSSNIFDPTKPSSLLYYHTPTQRYQLEGVMYTASPDATEDELNQRIPLSIVRWHEHTNFCGAPADKVKEYFGDHPKFGMFGSIHTKDACQAEGGTFMPVIFTWMIHMFPYEDNLKDVFSMNDDVAHVH